MFDYKTIMHTPVNELAFDASFVNGVKHDLHGIVKSMSVRVAKNGAEFVTGTLQNQGVSIGFKIWSDAIVDDAVVNSINNMLVASGAAPLNALSTSSLVGLCKAFSLQGKCITFSATAKEFNGIYEWHIQSVKSISNDVTNYMPHVQNVDDLWNEFMTYVNGLPQAWQGVMNYVFHGAENVDFFTEFKKAWGGSTLHDAKYGGLLSHTVKMLRIFDTLKKNDVRLVQIDELMTTAIILHDLGKCEEIVDGCYTPTSIVPHPQRFALYMGRWQKEIMGLIGEDNFFRLCSAVLGHHNGFGDPESRSIYAAILHYIDMLEAKTTSIFDMLDNANSLKKSSSGNYYIAMDERTLYI